MANAQTEPLQVRAVSRYARVAPSKVRQVAAHIRGRGIDDARRVLALSPKGASEQLLKTLDSAVANAEHNNGLDVDDLIVTQATVDEGPTLRRYQPRAMGRATRIRKRTSHITVSVGAKPPRPAPGRGTPTPRAARGTEPGGSPGTDQGASPGTDQGASPGGEE